MLDDIAQKLVRMGVVELVIYHLRAAKEQAVQKNLAICCAKLCKIPKGLEIARSLQALSLLSSVVAQK